MLHDNDISRQVEREQHMLDEGVERYRILTKLMLDKGAGTRTKAGAELMSATMLPVHDLLVLRLKGKEAGVRAKAKPLLRLLDPWVITLVTAKAIINSLVWQGSTQKPQTATALGMQIGAALEGEFSYGYMRKMFKSEFDEGVMYTEKRSNKKHTLAQVLRWKAKEASISLPAWTATEKGHVGLFALSAFMEATGLVHTHTYYQNKRRKTVIKPTPELLLWAESFNRESESLFPVFEPMVCQPLDWEDTETGGYLSVRVPLIKRRAATPLYEDAPAMFSTVNSLQRTAWRVNEGVLGVVQSYWKASSDVGLPSREPLPIPVCPLGEGEKVEDVSEEKQELFAEWRVAASEAHTANLKRISSVIQVDSCINMAVKFRNEEAIYFPYQLDFRGRLYPVARALQPQGADYCKALLEFSNGKPLGTEEAAKWLAVHGANLWGHDKVSLEGRELWVRMHEEQIRAVAADPHGYTWWTEADKPWQFLAFCLEWDGYCMEGLEFESRMPVAADGSCNGLQHLSACLMDEEGGRHVNLIPATKPSDIYQAVADKAMDKLLEIADNPKAAELLDLGLSRKVVKRVVMCLPYGITLHSARSYIREGLAEAGVTEPQSFVDTLTPVVWSAIDDVVVKGREAMAWLQDAARIVCESTEEAVVWTAPTGLEVTQSYHKRAAKRISTVLNGTAFTPTIRDGIVGVNLRQQINGVVPNVVHSWDAAHLIYTVDAAVKEKVTDFAMVHDSFGTHASDMPVMSECIREAFIALHTGESLLQILKDEWQERYGVTLPPLPMLGTLDIEAVRDSQFFFA